MLRVITLTLVFNKSLVLKTKLLKPFLVYRTFASGNWLQMQMQHQPKSLHDQHKPSRLPHATPLSWCHQVNPSNILLWTNCLYIFLLPYNINPLPATSLTLQYFCTNRSKSISYKTLKVYLASICLKHIEQGLPDLTTDETLHPVCRG